MRQPLIASQHLLRGEGPVLDKGLAQMGHDRADDLEVQILHRMRIASGDIVALADIHTAGKADAAIDDHDLAVAAQV